MDLLLFALKFLNKIGTKRVYFITIFITLIVLLTWFVTYTNYILSTMMPILLLPFVALFKLLLLKVIIH